MKSAIETARELVNVKEGLKNKGNVTTQQPHAQVLMIKDVLMGIPK